MTKPRYTEERFMSILWTLYERTSNGNSIVKYGHFCKEMNITNAIFPILETHKVLLSKQVSNFAGRGKMQNAYTWNTIQPNVHMARKLMDEIKKRNKIANAKHLEKVEMLKRQEELEMLKTQEIEEQQKVNYTYVEPEAANENDHGGFNYNYDVFDSSNTTSTNNITTLKDNSTLKVQNKNVKKVSILWGLILIQW